MAEKSKKVSRWISLANLLAASDAIPAVAFPFNSQVPTVARVGQDYQFQFSASTFIPDNTNFTYSLSDQPEWLFLNSATRTLSGAPSSADVGASSFTLTAADETGAAHMPCVLVVSTNPAPQIQWSISSQLAASTNLSSSNPPTVTVLPSAQIDLRFQPDSFIDIVPRKLTYYATLSDHTPLPAWLLFNDKDISFTGTAPQLSAFPQAWDIDLIASDVDGFAGAAASFTIAIGTQQLVFVPEYQRINVTMGIQFAFSSLAQTLYLNGKSLMPGDLKAAEASTPSWLQFDPKTLEISGTIPTAASAENITVTVTDEAGNVATGVVGIVPDTWSLFVERMPVLTAYTGKAFSYHFADALFSSPNVELMVVLPESATWLQFDAATRILSGVVPNGLRPTKIHGTVVAKLNSGSAGQKETLAIDVRPATSRTTLRSTVTPHTATSSSPTHKETDAIIAGSGGFLSTGAVAGIVAGTIVAATLIVILLVCCWRRSRNNESYVEPSSPRKRTISRPILPPDDTTIAVTTDLYTDVEKLAPARAPDSGQADDQPAPQIALDLPTAATSRRMKWSKRFSRISHASSLGNGEEAIRADDNIPVLGLESEVVHRPHDSFSIPTEIARSSRQLSDLSPSKRAFRRMQEKRQSRQSIGLCINTGDSSFLPRHSSRGAKTRKRAVSSSRQSTLLDRSSIASVSTHGTSIFSTKPSDFPRPPTRSTMSDHRSIPAIALTEAEKRRSIRLVARSDSTIDNRSIHEKRQSFIRNRASTSLASPLFAHGSRASPDGRRDGRGSVAGSMASSKRRSKRGKSQLITYSESSSLEPRDPRRLSARVRSAFAPSFPRAITGSTISADDEGGGELGDASSEYYSTSSSITEADLVAEMALPRHQRSWVLPGEASPTPPPAPPTSRQPSSGKSRDYSTSSAGARQKWKDRMRERSSSPLSHAVAVPAAAHIPETVPKRRSRLSEPLSLVSNDSLSRGKLERPRLIHTYSGRPVSVEKVRRLSSLKADSEDARPGSEMYEAMESAGLMPPAAGESRVGSQRSIVSGPAFL